MNLPFMGILFFILHVVLLSVVTASENSFEGCPSEQFECVDRKLCIPLKWRCDGDNDCGGGNDTSDEENCDKKTCTNDEFSCNNGKCIPSRWQCDDENDCGDESDEVSDVCNAKECDDEQFRCGQGLCIPIGWRCDDHDDCEDGRDEKNCAPVTCSGDEFRCTSGNCITTQWRCDKDNDCGDNSDEINCPSEEECVEEQFKCNSTKCIENSLVCDGTDDCGDNSDEVNCPPVDSVNEEKCWDMEFTCIESKLCIYKAWKCDGDHDCDDGSDEQNCTYTCHDHQFKCGNNHCINKILRCNGMLDCQDGSDEFNCSDNAPSVCSSDQFRCPNNECLDHKKVCDHRNDCGDFADESEDICNKGVPNPCESDNGGCLQVCEHLFADKFYCDCFKGFQKSGNNSCDDIDECHAPHHKRPCSHTCDNLKGSYKCSCMDGYTLEHDGIRSQWYCKANGERPWLLFANHKDVRKIQLDSNVMKPVVPELSSAIAVDFDYQDGWIYWSDVGREQILRASLNNGSYMTEEVISDLNLTPDGIAVDWVYKHLYWTDTGHNQIGVANLDGSMRKTLITDDLDEPRAIVLDPKEGYIYWTDWGSRPRIERCGMNGDPESREEIITGDIGWPNGLTIDYADEQLYWIDAKLHKIGSSKLNGDGQIDVLIDAKEITHPFSIAVFEDTLFWTDWSSESIRSVHKFSGTGYTTIAIGLHAPMGIKIFHEYMQPMVTNHCGKQNGGCEHMCLPAPRKKGSSSPLYSCICANGYKLHSNRQTCIELDTSLPPVVQHTTEGPKPKVTDSVVETHTGNEGYTIVSSTNRERNETILQPKEESNNGVVIGITIGIIAAILVISALVFVLYRKIKNKGIKSLNFDNPVYKKTTEEQFRIPHSAHSRGLSSALQPLTAENEVV